MSDQEQFLLRTVGGPHPGSRVSPGPWPLPAELLDEGGKYVKESESQLPPQPPDGHLMRGAQYIWVAE